MDSEPSVNWEASSPLLIRQTCLLSPLICYLRLYTVIISGQTSSTILCWNVVMPLAWEADFTLQHFPCFRCLVLDNLRPYLERKCVISKLCGKVSYLHSSPDLPELLYLWSLIIKSANVNLVLCSSVTTCLVETTSHHDNTSVICSISCACPPWPLAFTGCSFFWFLHKILWPDIHVWQS